MRICQSQVSKQHYKNNKQSYVNRTRVRDVLVTEDNRRKFAEYLSCHPCVDCGEADIRMLDFDHVRGKKSDEISRMVNIGYSWPTIKAEIAKCEVRCANCHRIRESKKNGSWRQLLGF